MRVRLDKIASSTRNAELPHDVVLCDDIPATAGTVVVVRVLDEKSTYNELEDVHGRMMTYHAGDIVAGVLGARKALRAYSGEVPESVEVGDVLHLLNLGGVIGTCTSANPQVGPPCRVEVLGGVQTLQGPDRLSGPPASILPGPVPLAKELIALPPAIFVVGTCMHAGKTAAACRIVRGLTARGLTVGVAKVTGVALRRDTLEMVDHGAELAVTFADAGLPSTAIGDVRGAARGCLNELARRGMDVIVVEFGDGLLGEYGVSELLAEADIAAAASAVVLAASDPVAAWGGARLLEKLGLELTVVTGPATDNPGVLLDAPAANARTQGELLVELVLPAIQRRALKVA
jgi:hypothetical protein